MMIGLVRRLVRRIRYRGFDADLERELAVHRAMLEDEARAGGASAEEARYAAARQLGNATLAREAARGVWIAPWLEGLWQDVRFAARSLRATPAFTLPALLVLTITMGLTTGLYAAVESVLLRPWPVPEPHRMVSVNESRRRIYSSGYSNTYSVGMVEYQYLSERVRSLELIARSDGSAATIRARQVEETIPVRFVSGNYFDVLRLPLALGRPLHPSDDVAGAETAVVISHDLWQRVFGGSAEVIGSAATINKVPVTIVGVMGDRARDQRTSAGGWMPQAWVPMRMWPVVSPMSGPESGGPHYIEVPAGLGLNLAGRLRPGVDRRAAEAEIRTLARSYASLHDVAPLDVSLSSTGYVNDVNAEREVRTLSLLSMAVALMLLLGCANVGNLQLARGLARSGDLAVRRVLGAPRGRLVRHSLLECLLLSLVAGAASLALATLVLPVLLQRVWPTQAGAAEVGWRAVLFAAGLVVGASALAGLLPALSTTRVTAQARHGPAGAPRLRATLLAFQLAVSVVLLVGGGLLVRGIHHGTGAGLGFDLTGAVAVRVNPPAAYTAADRTQLARSILDAAELRGLPRVAGALSVPYVGPEWNSTLRASHDESGGIFAYMNHVSAEYFGVLGVPLLEGRLFDSQSRPEDVVINETLARWLSPGETAVGRVFFAGTDNVQEVRVLGVVGDTRTFQFDAQAPTYYSSQPDWFRYMLVRNEPGAAVRLRDLIRTLEPAATPEIQPLGVELGRQIEGPTMIAAAGTVVSVLALLIASVGTLGIFSYIVNERTREIGVRLALGARARDIVRTIVAHVSWPLAGGLLAGLLGAQALSGVLGNRLYGISPRDPIAYAVVLFVLIVSAILAAWIPARRALRIDPAVTLRAE